MSDWVNPESASAATGGGFQEIEGPEGFTPTSTGFTPVDGGEGGGGGSYGGGGDDGYGGGGDDGAFTGECHNCQGTGHRAKDCPNQKCRSCEEVGHKSAECPNKKCRVCEETGHTGADCPNVKCKNCLETGHRANECKLPRKEDTSNVPEEDLDEAWKKLKAASDDNDLDAFKEAFSIYVKAAPDATLPIMQSAFVDDKLVYWLVAVTKELEKSQTVVDLQGNQGKKFVVTFQKGLTGKRKKLASKDDRYPKDMDENLSRLADAGFVKESFEDWCRNCEQKGHIQRDCKEEERPKEFERVIIKCINCDEEGHRVRDCPQERAKRGGGACFNCGEEGHSKADCTNETVDTRPPKPCFNCGEVGHNKADCTAPRKVTCRNCNQDGHMSKECPEPRKIICRNCDEEGHVSRDCPKPFDIGKVKCSNCSQMGHFAKRCAEPAAGGGGGDSYGGGGGDSYGAAAGGDSYGSAPQTFGSDGAKASGGDSWKNESTTIAAPVEVDGW